MTNEMFNDYTPESEATAKKTIRDIDRMASVWRLYSEHGITLNWFPFRSADGSARYRIYATNTREWKFDDPCDENGYRHFATLEEAIDSMLERYRDKLD